MSASEASAPDDRPPQKFRKFSSVDWGSVRNILALTRFDTENGDSEGGGAGNGASNGASNGLDGAASDRYTPSDRYAPSSSRYDPGSVERVGDINNLVVEDDSEGPSGAEAASSDAAGSDGTAGKKKKNRVTRLCVQALAVLAIACVAVGGGLVLREVVLAQLDDGQQDQQRLLETAEDVVAACGGQDPASDYSECMRLCQENMCCVEEGEGSCLDDRDDCAVYAGCATLAEQEELRLFKLSQQILYACSEPAFSRDESDCAVLCVEHLCCLVEGEFSCANDESMNCDAYYACEALVPEVTWN